jgi:hypothetical protein
MYFLFQICGLVNYENSGSGCFCLLIILFGSFSWNTKKVLKCIRCKNSRIWKWRILKIIFVQYDDHLSWEQPEKVLDIMNLQGSDMHYKFARLSSLIS